MKTTILTTAFIALLASVVDAQACSDNYTGPGCETGVYDPNPTPVPEPEPTPEPTPEPKDPPKKPKPVKKPEPKKPARPSLDNGFDAGDIRHVRTRVYCPEPKKSLITDQRYLGGKYGPERCCVEAVSRRDARKTCEIMWGKK